jgi:DNA replication and repair protein RecF
MLEVLLTNGLVNGRRTQRRLYSINNVRRQKRLFLGQFPVVIFRPEDLRLIEGSPSRRRKFLDTVLAVTHKQYALALHTYEDALKRRNRLLSLVREGEQPRTVLTYWTQAILKHGQIIQAARAEWLYTSTQVDFPLPFTVKYLPSVISEERLAKYAENEIAAGHTLIGPHKDDFIVKLPLAVQPDLPLPIAGYGSRGQQRLAVLWLKFAEYSYLETTLTQIPVLLLDDILSELDDEHRRFVFALLGKGQVIMTTADSALIPELRSRFPDIDVQELALETT